MATKRKTAEATKPEEKKVEAAPQEEKKETLFDKFGGQ